MESVFNALISFHFVLNALKRTFVKNVLNQNLIYYMMVRVVLKIVIKIMVFFFFYKLLFYYNLRIFIIY